MMNMCMFMLESNFKEDGFDSNVLMSLLDTSEDLLYVLDLHAMRTAQLADNSLMLMAEKNIASKVNSNTNYPYKSVNGVEFIHKNNWILVPESKQQSLLDWYHVILIHPGK